MGSVYFRKRHPSQLPIHHSCQDTSWTNQVSFEGALSQYLISLFIHLEHSCLPFLPILAPKGLKEWVFHFLKGCGKSWQNLQMLLCCHGCCLFRSQGGQIITQGPQPACDSFSHLALRPCNNLSGTLACQTAALVSLMLSHPKSFC